MKYLLDTHVLLWWLDNESPLNAAVRHNIDDGNNEIIVSTATIWEIGIKKALKKFQAPEDLLEILEKNGITILPILAHHAYAVRSLPLLHGDPFDRILVMQAILENLTIITHDKAVHAYSSLCPPMLKV